MKDRIKDFFRLWREDYHFRTVSTAMISALISFGFTIFNGVLGILYQSVWNISICIYYVLLAIVRRIIVCSQRKTGDKNQEKEKIKNTYVVTHMILILIDMALVVPIASMVRLTMWTSAGIWCVILIFTVKSFMMIRKM